MVAATAAATTLTSCIAASLTATAIVALRANACLVGTSSDAAVIAYCTKTAAATVQLAGLVIEETE